MRFRLIILSLALCTAMPAFAQSKKEMRSGRQKGWSMQQVYNWLEYVKASSSGQAAYQQECPDFTESRSTILNGNKITTEIFNFGSISSPGNTITDILWNGLGYGYEFGPFVGAEVVDEGRRDPQSVPQRDENGDVVMDAEGDTVYVMHIISDGLTSNGGELSPDGSERWGWHPIPCAEPVGNFEGLQVVNPDSRFIPTSDDRDTDLDGKPDPWPEDWYNPNLERYVWPGALQQGASNADKEALYFMNDYGNREFTYVPFPSDTARKGLGLEVETRLYQWSNPLAEDAIFLIYKITNKSEKDLDKVVFGMWGDPHVGGPSNWQDDLAFFDDELNMVFAWDADGRSDIAGRTPGYFGYKFLESPGRGSVCIGGRGASEGECTADGGAYYPGDGIDNDEDGLVDESWTDGIDNDADWDPEVDDVGVDGLPGTGDEGENDGVPTPGDQFDITKPGEPNFEFTDIDESDMIGLTSFASPPFAGNSISNDERVWDFVTPGRFDEVPAEPGDYVFLYGSGYFPLRAGETKRFSIALLVGENLNDLTLNANTVQSIYDVGYRFAKPPEKPVVTAVPGDEQVTLYWDRRAEASFDPLTRENDFEGYVIYRSTDPQFADQQTITDVNGTRFLYRPLTDERGVEAKFDLENGLTGPSVVPFPDRGVAYDLGEDTGLYHTYVDTNNVVNGQTYYYTVVAYDRGFVGDAGEGFRTGIPPSETSKTITFNPTTDSYIFDVNTVQVVPRPSTAGYVPPEVEIDQSSGAGTGDVRMEIVDPLAVLPENTYRLDFEEVDGSIVYSVLNETPTSYTFRGTPGQVSSLGRQNIVEESFSLRTTDGNVLSAGTEYVVNPTAGTVQLSPDAPLAAGDSLIATYTYAPLYQSELLAFEEGNAVFDGMHIFVRDNVLAVDQAATGWAEGGGDLDFRVTVATAGPGREAQPFDYEIRFGPTTTSIVSGLELPFEVVNITRANQQISTFVPDLNGNGVWDVDEAVIFVESLDGTDIATWEVEFLDPDGTASIPPDGSVFFLKTTKPFDTNDAFTFTTRAAASDSELAREGLDDVYVVPNPYVATNELEPRNPIANTERGDRRLYFANVPMQCTIRIYTLAGELVDVIEHDSSIDDGKAFWDLRSSDNMNIAYGLYLFHVDSAEGSMVGKFAVIK